MNQAVMLINCYLYGATVVMLLVLLLIVYLRGQVNHFPNPFVKKNLVYQHPAQAKGMVNVAGNSSCCRVLLYVTSVSTSQQ